MFDGKDFKIEGETKPGVFSLEGLIAWLRTQEPAKEYDYLACDGTCLLDAYLIAHGATTDDDGGADYKNFYQPLANISVGDDSIEGAVACATPYTYGAALQRAEALLRA